MKRKDWNLIVSAVSDAFSIHPTKILARGRPVCAVEARAACFLIARSQFPDIHDGTLATFARKHRSAVCYARNKAAEWFEVDQVFRRKAQEALKRFLVARHPSLSEVAA